MKQTVTRNSVLLAVAVAAVAACQGAPVAPVSPPADTVFKGQVAQALTEAQRLGLVKASVPLAANGFQVRSGDLKNLESVVVTIGDQRLTTDANGAIAIPQELIDKGEPLIAIIEAEGMVPVRKRILPGQALVLQPLDAAITQISAASGGVATNSDGTMLVEFGPGALDKDVSVRVTRTYVANPIAAASVHPGFAKLDENGPRATLGAYGYHLDLGGANILPGASVMVRFKTEKVMQDALNFLEKERMLDKTELSKEVKKSTDGTYYLNMKVPAPLAAPESSASVSKYSLLGAVCNQWLREEEPYSYPVYTQERFRDCYSGDSSYDDVDGLVDIIHDSRVNNGHCIYMPPFRCSPWPTFTVVTWVSGVRYWDSSTINARVAYQSNDSRINGKPIGGALVSFSHSGTPVRAATGSAFTASDGYASGVGKQGAGGSATVSYSAEPYTWGTSAPYSVNCGTVNLGIVKNQGQLALSFNNTGTPISGSVAVGSSHGNLALSGFGNQTVAVAHNNIANVTENVTINGGNWTLNGYQVDMNPASSTTKWNTTSNVGLSAWHNATLNAKLQYASNDTTVPADQQPTTKWNGQSVSGAALTFTHPVSASTVKPAGRDTLSFTGVNGNQTAWGIRGSNSAVAAELKANGITLSGNSSAAVDNSNVTVPLTANLPRLVIPFSGEFSDPVVISYKLDNGTLKTINLPAPTGSSLSFHLPVEDALNNPSFHSLKIVSIANSDFSRILEFRESDGSTSTAYPEVSGLRRGSQLISYGPLVANTNAAK
jgi:hypothetical protein